MTFAFYSLLTFFFVLCLLFVGLILIQKGRGGGLASAFGGAGGNTAFGSKTGDVLTWATSVVFGIFLICCVLLSLLATEVDRRMTGKTVVAPGAATTGLPGMAVPSTPTTQPLSDSPAARNPDQNLQPTTQPDWVPTQIPAGNPQ